jgi:RimJ/RimL family protein N-acetyltransferase
MIRKATVLDLNDIVTEGIKSLKMFNPGWPIDRAYLMALMREIILTGVIYVDYEGSEFKGVICGKVQAMLWYPEVNVLHELFWWVPEKHRGSSSGLRLLNAFIEHAKNDPSIHHVTMTKEHDSPLNPKVYIKRGFSFKEDTYIMEV